MTSTLLSPVLNDTLVHRALLEYHNCPMPIKVNNVEYKLSLASGENFCSNIYVVNVCYELNGNALEKSFIVKIMLPEVAEMETNENRMLTTVLPGMESCLVLANDNDGGSSKLFARCLVSEKNGHEFYVLENLNTLGYFCADRFTGLDESYGSVLMKKIGKFHAASMLYAKKFPNVIGSLQTSHCEHGATTAIQQAITFGGLEYVALMIKSWPGYESTAYKVKNIIPRYNDLLKHVMNPENAKFKVLNHGDLWVNNILFKKDSNTNAPIDALFVDFQNCFWGGCGTDLHYFLNTSLELEVWIGKRMDLLNSYYVSLSSTLASYSYPVMDIPSWDEVVLEFKRSELIGLYATLCELPIVTVDKSVSKDFTTNTFANSEKMKQLRRHMYANDRVKESLRYTLKYYERIGILE